MNEQKDTQELISQLAAIVKQSDEAIICKTLDNIITSWNTGAEKIYGYSADEVIGRDISFLLPPGNTAVFELISDKIKHGDTISHSETIRMKKDGEQIPVSMSVSPIKDSKGQVVGALTIARDITEQKQLADALNAEKERLNVTLHSIGDGVIVTGPDGKIALINEVAEKLTGWSANEAMGRPLYEVFQIIDEKTRNSCQNSHEKSMSECTITGEDDQIILITRDGIERSITKIGTPIRNNESIIGVIIIFQDITQTRQTEKAFQESETRYRRLFETAQDGILILDGDTGTITDANPFIIELIGYNLNELQGKKIWEIGFIRDKVLAEKAAADLKMNKYLRYEDLPLETKDGRSVDVEFVSNVYIVDDKRIIQCNIRDITDRKLAEDKLSSSEIQYRTLFETTKDGILILDGDTGTIIDANPFILDLLKYQKEDLLNRSLWEIGFIGDKDLAEKAAADLKVNKYIKYEDLPLKTNDGKSVDVEFVSNVYTVGEKKIIQCNIRNISDRKRAEEKLSSSEIQFRMLFETTKDGILILDGDTGTITDANPFILNLLKYQKEDLIHRSLWEIGFIWDKDLAEKAAADLKVNKYVRYEDLPLETKDGKSVDVEFVSNVYRIDDRKIIQCNIRDISDRKRAEEKLSSSEIQYRTLFETTKDGILILDGNSGTIIDANPFILDLLKYQKKDLMNRSLWEIGFIRDKDLAQKAAADLKVSKYVKYEDLPLETKDGKSVDVEFVSNVYTIDNKKIIQCNIRDVTDRKILETEIAQALKEKEVLLKEIHHRVKNNIQVISSLLNIQSQQAKDPAIKEIFRETHTKVKGIALVHEMLYQNKSLSEIDYASYLKNLTTFVFHSYNVNSHQIGLRINAENMVVSIDKAIPLSLIINELLTNALKYAFPENIKGEIIIGIQQNEDNLILTFSDNGIGLPMSVTFDKTDTLGMALLAGLTQQLDGTISVERKKGTQYTIIFPISDDEE